MPTGKFGKRSRKAWALLYFVGKGFDSLEYEYMQLAHAVFLCPPQKKMKMQNLCNELIKLLEQDPASLKIN